VDGRRSAFDPDELEEEQRDRERRKKINHEFRRFTKRVQEAWDRDFSRLKLEWDMPYRCTSSRRLFTYLSNGKEFLSSLASFI
jgi:nucleosome binding factor SPN SPT16 subunit